MRYGIRWREMYNAEKSVLRFATIEQRESWIVARRFTPSVRVERFRILSPAESRAKFAATKLRERAEALRAMPEAQHPESDRDYDRGVAYGLRCAARLLNAEADELWPGKRGG